MRIPGFLYSGEAEILFGPMTGLEVLHAGRIHGTMNHYVMRRASTHSIINYCSSMLVLVDTCCVLQTDGESASCFD